MSMRKTIVAATIAAVAVLSAAGTASASDSTGNGSQAIGGTWDSSGFLSGNVVQVPLNIPVNLCGNDLSILSALTGALGNSCTNG